MALKICYIVGVLLVVLVWSRVLGNTRPAASENHAAAVLMLHQLQEQIKTARSIEHREYLERRIEEQKRLIVRMSGRY
jgi:hypothetical protein